MSRLVPVLLITIALIATFQSGMQARFELHTGSAGISFEIHSGKSS